MALVAAVVDGKALGTVCIFYTSWIIVHYIASHLYVYYCVPWSPLGIVWSPLIISAPHCTAMRWCVQNGAAITNGMWLALGAFLYNRTRGHTDSPPDPS